MSSIEVLRESLKCTLDKFGLPSTIPETVILTKDAWTHILKNHDENFNREKLFLSTIRDPDRFVYQPNQKRLGLYKYLYDGEGNVVAMNCVWLKPVINDAATYINTSIVTTEKRNIRKWTNKTFITFPGGTGEPSSPVGIEASLSSTSGKF